MEVMEFSLLCTQSQVSFSCLPWTVYKSFLYTTSSQLSSSSKSHVARYNSMGKSIPLFTFSPSCSNQPSDCYLNISQPHCSSSSSCHSLKDTASASIISILLQCHTCSFISHPIAGIVSIARRRALSPTSLSCAPRCGPLSHPLSAGNYTHLKPITTSKGTGTGK